MKKIKILTLIVLCAGIGSFTLMSMDFSYPKKLRHVVAFKFKPDVTEEQIRNISRDFHALEEKIPQIIEFEGGADFRFSRGGLDSDRFTHCFIVTVKNEKELAAYGAHPDHQAFSSSADPLLKEVMVVDYWSD